MKRLFEKNERKPRHELSNSERGFTLVELCIVIAITAIVVVLCCTFIISYNGSVNKVKAYKEYMNEISTAKMAVTNWINAHDSAYYSIAENASTKGLSAAYKDNSTKNGSISFTNGVLACAGNNVSTTSFRIVNKIEFGIDGALLLCTIGADGQEDVPLAFPLFSKTERDRYASSEKIDIAKLASIIDEWVNFYFEKDILNFFNLNHIRVGENGMLEAGTANVTASLEYQYDAKKGYGNLIWERGLGIQTKTSYILGSVKRIKFNIVKENNEKVIKYTLYETTDMSDTGTTYTITKNDFSADIQSKWNNILKTEDEWNRK